MMIWLDTQVSVLLELLPVLAVRSSLIAMLLLLVSMMQRWVSLRLVRTLMMVGVLALIMPPIELLQSGFPLDQLIPTVTITGMAQPTVASGTTVINIGWLVLLYPPGVLFLLILMGFQTVRFAARFGGATSLAVDSTMLPDHVRLCQSSWNHSPFLVGYRKPVIVVPPAWKDWKEGERMAVVHHELGHLLHRDNWSGLLMGLVTAVYFFNPLIWLLKDRLELIQELRADQYATRHNRSGAAEFARQLVNVAGSIQHTQVRAPGLALTEPYRRLVHRVNHLFWEGKENRMKQSWIRSLMVIAIVVTGLALVSVRGVGVQAASLDDEKGEDVIVQPRPEMTVQPKYPEEAKKRKLTGFVLLSVVVDKDGSVESIKVVKSPHEAFTKAAIVAVEQWNFEPGTRNGKAEKMSCTVNVRFQLDGEGTGSNVEPDNEAPPKKPKKD